MDEMPTPDLAVPYAAPRSAKCQSTKPEIGMTLRGVAQQRSTPQRTYWQRQGQQQRP
jgi:hypothetical protein